ncbi:hypothetical protein ACFL4T_01950 [candidate division KSB1 bacterium]
MKKLYSYDIGDKIEHKEFGIGRIVGIFQKDDTLVWKVVFQDIGEKKIDITEDQLITEEKKNDFDINKLKSILGDLLDEKLNITPLEIAEKWENGKIVIMPGKEGLKSYELPIDALFHKIVMIRDRLRVLEQRINSEEKLSDADKVNMQQYITRIYGSLTSFNQFFDDRKDWFVGEKGK